MSETRTTESPSNFDNLENKSVIEIITGINQEDATIAKVLHTALAQIGKLIEGVVIRMKEGGRLFYIGAGTSGRLGILDASEIPPTYGVHNKVIGIIAGGDTAIRNAVEFAEDDMEQAWKDLTKYDINANDFLLGIAASGTTPYVLGGIQHAKKHKVLTGCIVCNSGSVIANTADYAIELLTGAEYVTGSTRMKAGTAQKMALNMISTAVMIQLGKVKGNKMVEMQLSNNKLWSRATKMLVQELGIDSTEALALIQEHKSVKRAIAAFNSGK